jgi:hypothetical protein
MINGVDGWCSKPSTFALYSIARCTDSPTILEIGSYKGRSTLALALGNPSAKIFSCDPHTGDLEQRELGLKIDTFSEFLHNLASAGVTNVSPAKLESTEFARIYKGPKIDIQFIDGLHTYDAVVQDIEAWVDKMNSQRTVIFDDYSRPEIFQAIVAKSQLLPSYLGTYGQFMIFSNCQRVRRSNLGFKILLERYLSFEFIRSKRRKTPSSTWNTQ